MRAHLRPVLALLVTLIPSALWGQSDGTRDLDRALERLAKGEQITGLPKADSVTKGTLTIPAGTTRNGTAVAQGPVVVLAAVMPGVCCASRTAANRAPGAMLGR